MSKCKDATGTREWSTASDNVWCGCPHRCRYCYARYNAVERYGGKCPSHWMWGTRYNHANKKNPSRGGRRGYSVAPPATVMFPTTHDITPANLDRCLLAIGKNLELGYRLLIVSKPHLDCIEAICERFADYRDKIEFRFSIGASFDSILEYWEPGAPCFADRYRSLEHAYKCNFQTSVSCEPVLDVDDITNIFHSVKPLVTSTIWIGKLNEIRARCIPGTSEEKIRKIEAGQTDQRCLEVYEMLKDEPKVRWKKEYRDAINRAKGGER